MDNDNWILDIGLELGLIVLAIILIPLVVGLGVAFLVGFTDMMFYSMVLIVAVVLWLIVGLFWWL